jgi:hypothetical protein
VGSTVINAGGSLVPGPVGVPGSMAIAGSLAFQSGALYVVQVTSSMASISNVTGTASLAGTVLADFSPGSHINQSYTILTAAGGFTGTFDALATFGLPVNFGASLQYTSNSALLNIMAQLVPEQPEPQPQPPAPPFTINQLNVGHAIDNFFNNGGTLPPAFVSLFGLTGNNLTIALDELSGEAATGAQRAAFQLGGQFLNVMLDPFVDGRSGIGGTDHPPLGFAPDTETRPSAPALAFASVVKAPRRRRPMGRTGRCGAPAMAAATRPVVIPW